MPPCASGGLSTRHTTTTYLLLPSRLHWRLASHVCGVRGPAWAVQSDMRCDGGSAWAVSDAALLAVDGGPAAGPLHAAGSFFEISLGPDPVLVLARYTRASYFFGGTPLSGSLDITTSPRLNNTLLFPCKLLPTLSFVSANSHAVQGPISMQPPTRSGIDTEARTSATATAVRRADGGPASPTTCTLVSCDDRARNQDRHTPRRARWCNAAGRRVPTHGAPTQRAAATPVEGGAGLGRGRALGWEKGCRAQARPSFLLSPPSFLPVPLEPRSPASRSLFLPRRRVSPPLAVVFVPPASSPLYPSSCFSLIRSPPPFRLSLQICRLESESECGRFDVMDTTSNGRLTIGFPSVPHGAMLELAVCTSNAKAEVALPCAYEGMFALTTSG
ncbi:hypothetical protein DFH09DRAFT_1292639 [Mycena vulgaris]|nr:hypothetical protein DFH09DRAFT_1292639 [Mycena vulgaris]